MEYDLYLISIKNKIYLVILKKIKQIDYFSNHLAIIWVL